MDTSHRVRWFLFACALAACKAYSGEEPATPTTGDGGASPPAVEDCFDGADDNGDGKRDCEEPSCAAYAHCVPGPGALEGWTGYFALVAEGDCPGAAPAAIGDVWISSTDAATCACTCAASITCTGAAKVAESASAGCNPLTPFELTVGQCGSIPPAPGSTAAYWALADLGTPSCTAKNDAPRLGPKYARARLCGGARLGAGCPSGGVCAAGAYGSPDAPTLCVSRPHAGGAPVACPAAFPVVHLVAAADRDPEGAFDDRRTCESCSCDDVPTGASCNAKLTLASDASCNTVAGQVTGTSCSNVSCGGPCQFGRVDVNPNPGTCAAHGGGPSGTIDLVGSGQQLCCER